MWAGTSLEASFCAHSNHLTHSPAKWRLLGFLKGAGLPWLGATQMPDLVYAVVAYYPETRFITNIGAFVSKMKVPTLMFVGVLDTFKDCCVIERARQLAAAAAKEGRSLRLVEYPDAGHAFAIKNTKGWRGNDSADAFRKTLDYLKQGSA
jgi:dienelactone hydrolase